MSDEFIPTPKYTLTELTEQYKQVIEKILSLNSGTKQLLAEAKSKDKSLNRNQRKKKYYTYYKKIVKNNKKLERLHIRRAELKKEMEQKMKEIQQPPFEDEIRTPYNECIGYCYGKCIYINDEGEIRYREADKEDAEQPGESCAATEELIPLNDLSDAEIKMIMDYLQRSPETPRWFVERTEKEKEE